VLTLTLNKPQARAEERITTGVSAGKAGNMSKVGMAKRGLESDWTKILTVLIGIALITGGYRQQIDNNTSCRKNIVIPLVTQVAVLKEQSSHIPEMALAIKDIRESQIRFEQLFSKCGIKDSSLVATHEENQNRRL